VTSAPTTGLLTRFLLENPWPLCIMLLLAAIVLAKFALDRADQRMLLGSLGCVLASAAVFVTAWIVVTPGEHARRVVRTFVDAAEAGDMQGMQAVLAPDASLHIGALTAPGMDRSELDRALSMLEGRHRIESNTVTALRAGPLSADAAVAELSCFTTTSSSFGPVQSTWLFRVEQTPQGTWNIRRIAGVSMAGRAAERPPW